MKEVPPLVELIREWSEEDDVERIDDRGHTIRVRYSSPEAVSLGGDRARSLLEDYDYAVLAIGADDGVVLFGCVRRASSPREIGDPAAEFVGEAGTIGAEQH